MRMGHASGGAWPTPNPAPFCPYIEEPPRKRKLGKNPDVDTSFLPDRDREVNFAPILGLFGVFLGGERGGVGGGQRGWGPPP